MHNEFMRHHNFMITFIVKLTHSIIYMDLYAKNKLGIKGQTFTIE